jgi:transcription elongation factor Elf1
MRVRDSMNQIVLKKRTVGGYKYSKCEECKHEKMIEKPIQLDLPYCGSCGKSVEDANQKFCGWCGIQFESERKG